MTERQTALLAPFACLFAGIDAALDELTPDELAELLAAAQDVRRNNCWCFTYAAGRYLTSPLAERLAAAEKDGTRPQQGPQDRERNHNH